MNDIPPSSVTKDELLAVLYEADGLLSLVGYRYKSHVGADLAGELQEASSHCRMLAKRLEEHGLKRGHTLTSEDWLA